MEADTTPEEDTIRTSDRNDNDVPAYEELIEEGAKDSALWKEYLAGRSQEQFFYHLRQMARSWHLIYTYKREGPNLRKDAKKIGLSYKKCNLFAKLQGIRSDIEAIVEKERKAKGDNYKYPTISMMESWLPDHKERAKPVPRKILEKQVEFLKGENATLRAELAELQKPHHQTDDETTTKADVVPAVKKRDGARPGAGRKKNLAPVEPPPPSEHPTPRQLADLVKAAATRARERGLTCEIVKEEFNPIYLLMAEHKLAGKQEFAEAAHYMTNTRFFSSGVYPKKPYVSDAIFFWDQENYVSLGPDELEIHKRTLPPFPEEDENATVDSESQEPL